MGSFLASALFHGLLLLVLGLMWQIALPGGGVDRIIASTAALETLEGGEAPVSLETSPPALDEPLWEPMNVPIQAPVAGAPEVAIPLPDKRPEAAPPPEIGSPAWLRAMGPALFTPADVDVRGALAGRNPRGRADAVGRGDATPDSEEAVQRGLRWLVAHQRADGAWSFNHHDGPCQGQCRNPGTAATVTGATGLVLLPFLGAGYTHLEGEHKNAVGRGLYYLARHALVSPNGADLQDGTMYGHGLATIALCEAYAMTGDPGLKGTAQGAIDFIVFAQDRGGGWRYAPGQPGDVTVTGWQLMALKSGQMAGLDVPSPTIFRAQRFLDSVQLDDGAQYGYMADRLRTTHATTAIGLLCRMYTGWRRDNPALERGVGHLSGWGPSQGDLYFDYYAAQVLHHWGGPRWTRWYGPLRDHLVAAQAGAGHEAGSWFMPDDYGAAKGGRLYCTALAVMTLEVPYRYMPLYGPAVLGPSE